MRAGFLSFWENNVILAPFSPPQFENTRSQFNELFKAVFQEEIMYTKSIAIWYCSYSTKLGSVEILNEISMLELPQFFLEGLLGLLDTQKCN